jgi:hypothetical protein
MGISLPFGIGTLELEDLKDLYSELLLFESVRTSSQGVILMSTLDILPRLKKLFWNLLWRKILVHS